MSHRPLTKTSSLKIAAAYSTTLTVSANFHILYTLSRPFTLSRPLQTITALLQPLLAYHVTGMLRPCFYYSLSHYCHSQSLFMHFHAAYETTPLQAYYGLFRHVHSLPIQWAHKVQRPHKVQCMAKSATVSVKKKIFEKLFFTKDKKW